MLADPFSAVSHLLGAILVAAFGVPMLIRAHKGGHLVSVGIFVASAFVLMCASTTYHLLPHDTASREIARRVDHAAIFLLIAGTFTPIHMILFRGVLRWGVLTVIWACAIVGIALKLAFFNVIPDWLHTLAYVLMGWQGAIGAAVLIKRRGVRIAMPVIVAAGAYTIGAAGELFGQPTLAPGLGPHEVFHVAVLIGLSAFWVFIWRLAAGVTEPLSWRLVTQPDPLEVVVVETKPVVTEPAA